MHVGVIKVSYGDEDTDWRIFVKKYELTKDYSMDRVKVVHLIGKAIWYWLVNNQLYQRFITTLFLNCISIYKIKYVLKIDPQKGL